MTASSIDRRRQRGLTLVELLVAIVLMLMVTMATVALYSVNSSSKRTVDASQSLDDTARFAFELIGQAIHDAGYPGAVPEESDTGLTRRTLANPFDLCVGSSDTKPCPILGFDNSKVASTQGSVGSKDSGGVNSSDSLAIRFNGASDSAQARQKGEGNGSVKTCGGNSVALTDDETQLGMSIFWVATNKGEPELYCSEEYYQSKTPGAGWKRPSANPMARGVEVFKVMYGVDCQGSPCVRDGVPDRWVSAADVGSGNWPYVKAVRVGLIVRGPPGSAQAASGDKLYPLGKDFSDGQTAAGLEFSPPDDGRLRRVYTTTFMLRNSM